MNRKRRVNMKKYETEIVVKVRIVFESDEEVDTDEFNDKFMEVVHTITDHIDNTDDYDDTPIQESEVMEWDESYTEEVRPVGPASVPNE
jgi:hypothetical protein